MASASRQGYSRTRNLVLGSGLAVLVIIAIVMFVRRVETVEVLATLLFIPIFVAFIFQGVRGGAIAGVAAAIAYAAFRYPAIDLVGAGRFTSLIASRTVAFVAFGLIGGIATQQLRSSITKLDAIDQVDDETSLFNARFFVDNTGLEMQRSDRYHTLFCVAIVDVPGDPLGPLNRRQRQRLMRELGGVISDSARTMDRGVHAFDGRRHRFAVVLPETGRDGGRVFVSRLVEKMADALAHRGVRVDAASIESDVAMFPDDGASLQRLRSEFAEIEAREHPETAHTVTGVPTSSPEQRRG